MMGNGTLPMALRINKVRIRLLVIKIIGFAIKVLELLVAGPFFCIT